MTTPPAAALLEWGASARRDLPWRRTRDPWAVLVSELMLQQTQVARVAPRFGPFMARFPTVGTCAVAPAGDVVRAWAGLGYNRRALSLQRAAVEIVDRFGGRVPDDLPSLLSLPGVGAYTARAVLAFAYERDVGVLDVNAARVLARAWGVGDQAGADRLVPPGRGWEWNQAVLDLGATVCRARRADCGACPVAAWCAWRAAGTPEPDPAARGRRQGVFEGSDRQGRGRLLDALRLGPVALHDVAVAAGWPGDEARAGAAAAALVEEGFAVVDSGELRLA